MFVAKRATISDAPELFATYRVLAVEHSGMVADHVADLIEQWRVVIADGVGSGAFNTADPAVTARAVFDATTGYHHPVHADEWHASGI